MNPSNSCHSHAGGNLSIKLILPLFERWIPACAGMTLYVSNMSIKNTILLFKKRGLPQTAKPSMKQRQLVSFLRTPRISYLLIGVQR